MGLLANGHPLAWNEYKPYIEKLKWAGIEQFISLFKEIKDRKVEPFKWGEEIEYLMVKFDHKRKRVQLPLKSTEVLRGLQNGEFDWKPEFTRFILEGSTSKFFCDRNEIYGFGVSTSEEPYDSSLDSLTHVEEDLRRRRIEATNLLDQNESLISIPRYPRLGCPDFTFPPASPNPNGECAKSIFFPEEAICDLYPRFGALMKNVQERRGSNMAINVPIFHDERTPKPFREDFSDLGKAGRDAAKMAEDDAIFGSIPGSCGLQVTIQVRL